MIQSIRLTVIIDQRDFIIAHEPGIHISLYILAHHSQLYLLIHLHDLCPMVSQHRVYLSSDSGLTHVGLDSTLWTAHLVCRPCGSCNVCWYRGSLLRPPIGKVTSEWFCRRCLAADWQCRLAGGREIDLSATNRTYVPVCGKSAGVSRFCTVMACCSTHSGRYLSRRLPPEIGGSMLWDWDWGLWSRSGVIVQVSIGWDNSLRGREWYSSVSVIGYEV